MPKRTAKSRILETTRGDDSAAAELAGLEGDRNFVASLARGLKVIEAFEAQADGLSVSAVAERSGISRASARRLLLTLERLGYAETDGRFYRLRNKVLGLGFSYLSSASLPLLAQPILEQLTNRLHESSSVSELDGDEIIYVARSAAKRAMSVGLSIGSRLPAYCTSMGRVLLSGLPEAQLDAYLKRARIKKFTAHTVISKSALAGIIEEIRQNGFALTDQELELGLRSIAVPVRNIHKRVVAAMNIGVPAARISIDEMIRNLLPLLRENAQKLSRLLM